MSTVRVRVPATSANLGAGFDVFGLALDCLYDEVTMELTGGEGIEIEGIDGYDVPAESSRNCAAVAAMKVFELEGYRAGARMRISKGIRPKSGLGSSAASSVGGALAASLLLGGLGTEDLLRCAGEGECISSMSAHLDNVAPALLGGFTIVRSYDPLEVVRLEVPENLGIVAILPDVEVGTREARAILPESVPVRGMVHNVGNAGAFVAGMMRKDVRLMGRAMDDAIFERAREPLVPWLRGIRGVALDEGACGLAMSGSGPSVIALFDRAERDGEAVREAMVEAFADRGMDSAGFVCSAGSGAEEVRS